MNNALSEAKSLLKQKIRETGGKNRHPVIDKMLKNVGSALGNPWCAAFVSFCFKEATGENPPFASASSQAIKRWAKKEGRLFTDPDHLKRCKGAIFGWTNEDKIHGHVGLVAERLTSKELVVKIGTIEGNTDPVQGDRDGQGLYELRRNASRDRGHELWFVDTTGIDGGEWW